MVPALVVYIFVMIYPSIVGAVTAFTDARGRNDPQFIGLDNFVRLMSDRAALGALGNTLIITVSLVLFQTLLGLLLAVLLSPRLHISGILRTVFFIPFVLPPLIIGVLWQYLYTPGGPIDTVLEGLGLGFLVQSWLGDPSIALWSVIAAIIWQNVGVSMIIFIAGLERIPAELYEASSLDGAGAWSTFWNVTRPLLAPATTIALTLTLVGSLKLFDQVFVMTGGGPGYATQTLSLIMYQQAFVLGNYGYGTAIALVLTILVAFAAFIQVTISRRYERDV
ncbi:sugar ABC transporter permease [Microbacterium sp. NPDC076911]|uniref:carbohydrate ABC transporter permease n=1 Tax=Microbacterium sp. NPDC076911 TaxID=3154958 RepID=UPI00341A5042